MVFDVRDGWLGCEGVIELYEMGGQYQVMTAWDSVGT
jgi:hypothetical protein